MKRSSRRSPLRPIVAILLTAALSSVAVVAVFGTPSAGAQPATSAQPAPNPDAKGAPAAGGTQSTVTPPVVTQPGKDSPAPAGAEPGPAPDPAKNQGAAQTAEQPAGAPAPAAGVAPAAPAAPVELAWYDKLVTDPIADDEGTFWMPKSVNVVTDSSDLMFIAILALTAFFFIAITAAVIYLVWKYRHRPGHKPEPSAAHNDALEVTWTVIPTIITVFLFYYGWRSYINIVTPPQKAVEIQVQAWRWAWEFTHANGTTDSNLHVPVDTPVRLVMTSRDVLHAFYVPVLRTKQDIIPRRYTYVWFHATKPGTYRLACAEYCGTNHSQMGITNDGRRAVVVVHKPGDYERYLSETGAAGGGDPAAYGAKLYEKKGCVSCHSTDGSTRVGPSFKGTFGAPANLASGPVTVDETYLRESILYPNAKARTGFPVGQMPSFEGQLKEKEIEGLIAFIKSLK